MEAYVQKVSTCKVDDLVVALGAASGISKSEVSRICSELDAAMVAAAIRTIFAQPSTEAVYAQFDRIVATLGPKSPTVAGMLSDARDDLLAFSAFPIGHWRKIWSTNPLERLHREIKRRADVVGVFPND
jgi:transposase-like protein